MEILSVNIWDVKSGSAIVAYRLAKSLEKNYGTTNLFLVRNKFTKDKNVIRTRKNIIEDRIE